MEAWSLETAGRQIQGQILLQCNPGEANGNLLNGNLCPIRTQELCTWWQSSSLWRAPSLYSLYLSKRFRGEFLCNSEQMIPNLSIKPQSIVLMGRYNGFITVVEKLCDYTTLATDRTVRSLSLDYPVKNNFSGQAV